MIRQVQERDRQDVGRVFCMGWKEGYRGILPDDYLDTLTVEKCTPKGPLASNCYAAEHGGTVVGVMNIGAARDAELAHFGELRAIYVHPDWWRHGIGRALFETAASKFTELGYLEFYLWVLKNNMRARHFYEAMGMVCTGDERMLSISGSDIAEVRYSYKLT